MYANIFYSLSRFIIFIIQDTLLILLKTI